MGLVAVQVWGFRVLRVPANPKPSTLSLKSSFKGPFKDSRL